MRERLQQSEAREQELRVAVEQLRKSVEQLARTREPVPEKTAAAPLPPTSQGLNPLPMAAAPNGRLVHYEQLAPVAAQPSYSPPMPAQALPAQALPAQAAAVRPLPAQPLPAQPLSSPVPSALPLPGTHPSSMQAQPSLQHPPTQVYVQPAPPATTYRLPAARLTGVAPSLQ